MTGIEDVARLAGVSTATVSRALSKNHNALVRPETLNKVLAAANELNYVASSTASGLSTGRTKNVGVVTPQLGRWFFTSVIEGAQRTLMQHGYDLTLYNLGGGAQRDSVFNHFLLRKRVDAVLAVALELTDDEIGKLLALEKPVVGVGGPLTGVQTFAIDDVAAAKLATGHLIGFGHTKIAHFGSRKSVDNDFQMSERRSTGYQAALAEAGIPIEPNRFYQTDFTIAGGYQSARRLLADPHDRPTAIFAASDEMAIGCILAARELGFSVPDDISIIGIDDHELSELFGLSTVAQFPARQGELAAGALLDLLSSPRVGDEPAPQQGTSLPIELILRTSTTRIR